MENFQNYLPDPNVDTEYNLFNIIELDIGHFVKLIKYEDLKIEDFNKEYRTIINRLSHGCCVLFVKLNRPTTEHKFLLPICAWKGRNTIRAYVAKNERAHLLRLCDQTVEQDLNNKGWFEATRDCC